MEQFKRAKVIMLPTKQKTTLYLSNTSNKLHLGVAHENNKYKENQYLYIISDDEIKEGDWCYNFTSKCIFKFIRNTNTSEDFNTISESNRLKGVMLDGYNTVFDVKTSKKIIATTDTSLTIKGEPCGIGNWYNPLPQPSQQFITKYIESYNKGEVITDLLVEYEVYKVTMACTCTDTITSSDCPNSYYDGIDNCCRKRFPNGEYWNKTIKLKVNPKDNTITIKKFKDSWNREEILAFGLKCGIAGSLSERNGEDFNKLYLELIDKHL